jgi:hypothetical protein
MKKKTVSESVKEKQYIVIRDHELWLIGSKQDIIDDFNNDTNAYIKHASDIKIYELNDPISFELVTAAIKF